MVLPRKVVDILKCLQLKNGGILATPKNGAYPYVYTRDAVFITKAYNRIGLVKNSIKYYNFLKKYANTKRYGEIFQRYLANGLPSVTREEENDNEGLVLYGIYDTYMTCKDMDFLESMWSLIEDASNLIISYISKGLIKTKRSIHEFYHLEHGYEIWSNSAAVRGLYDASKMAKLLGRKKEAELYMEKADLIYRTMRKKMFNKKEGRYIKNTRFKDAPDISILAPFIFELDNSISTLKKTMVFLKKYLWDTEIGGFGRFCKFEIVRDWHWYSGGSGSWITLTLWVERFYGKIGDKRMQKKCRDWTDAVMKTSEGMLPEHIALKKEYDEWKGREIEFNSRIINETKKSERETHDFMGRKIVHWANPLGWSHAEYVLTRNEK